MRRIDSQLTEQKQLAKQVLTWISFATRPLTTTELQHALGVEVGHTELDKENIPDLKDIVSACAGLVTVDRESNIIRLVHYTTQEYFQRTQNYWFPCANKEIATVCVTYLSFKTFENKHYDLDEDWDKNSYSSASSLTFSRMQEASSGTNIITSTESEVSKTAVSLRTSREDRRTTSSPGAAGSSSHHSHLSKGAMESDCETESDCGTDAEIERRSERHCFFSYVSAYWAHYVKAAQMEQDKLVLNFLKMESHVSTSIQEVIHRWNTTFGDDNEEYYSS